MAKRRWKAGWHLNYVIIESEYENYLLNFGYSDEEIEIMLGEEVADYITNLSLEESFRCLNGLAKPLGH